LPLRTMSQFEVNPRRDRLPFLRSLVLVLTTWPRSR
jgi:hypothetical protein